MFDPSEGKLNHDIDESMRMFEKALVDPGDPLEPLQPSRVLIALDGSTQQSAVIEAAELMRSRFDCKLSVISIRENDRVDQEQAEQIEPCPIDGAELIPPQSGAAYDQIISAVEISDPDLVVLPCPFGRDFESVGADSAGTVIDVMLSRCAAPMLIIRQPDQRLRSALERLSFIVAAECEAETLAAAWAFGLMQQGGEISLDVVVDKEQLENLRQVLSVIAPDKEIDGDDLNQALADSHTALHAKMQKAAMEGGFSYSLVPNANESAPPVFGEETSELLIVLPSEVDDRFVQGFVHDRIRRSPHPVLVVPTHVGSS